MAVEMEAEITITCDVCKNKIYKTFDNEWGAVFFDDEIDYLAEENGWEVDGDSAICEDCLEAQKE